MDLQINLLSEEENTKMFLMLQALCTHHYLPIGTDPESTALTQRTELAEVLTDLKENLPSSTASRTGGPREVGTREPPNQKGTIFSPRPFMLVSGPS